MAAEPSPTTTAETAAAQDWAVFQEPLHRPLWMAMQLAAGVKQGIRLLDAGCGSGGACFLAAHNYGAEVWGFDASEEMVKLARQRVPGGHFAVSDLSAPPFSGDSFHVISAANSLQFAQDPLAALRSWQDRLYPGAGSIVVGLWCPQDESEQIQVLRAMRALLSDPPPAIPPFALSERGLLEGMMRDAGLRVSDASDVPVTFEYPNLDTCWRAQKSGSQVKAAIRSVGEPAAHAAFLAAAQQFLMTDGSVFIHNKMRYVLGHNF